MQNEASHPIPTAQAFMHLRKARYANMQCKELLQRVSKICSGSKVVQHSDGSVHVINCPYWSPRDSTMLQYDCPGAVISVQSSVSSLSGFVVVIRQPITARGGAWRLFLACMAAAIAFWLIWGGMREECSAIRPFLNATIARQWLNLPKEFF
jgi:hypothetical protein